MRALVIVAALLFATPASAQDVGRWRPMIAEASVRFGVPASWIERVVLAESRGWTTLGGRPIRSPAGAMGLMQLMPPTWAEMRARLKLGADPDDPRDNILAGTLYLRLLYDRFGYPGLFAAYNAGPARYAAYLANRHALPRETADYLQTVAGTAPRAVVRPRSAPETSLFVVRRDDPPTTSNPAPNSAEQPALFAIRRGQ